MVINSYRKWSVRLGTLALWAAACASVVFWGLCLSAPAAGFAAPVVLPAAVAPDAPALARLLGAVPSMVVPTEPGPTLASRFALIGVLSGRASGGGAALIAVDGKPPKALRLGATVDEGLVLQAIGLRQVRIGGSAEGPSTLTLDMPAKR